MNKPFYFRSPVLPYLLIAPQILILAVFFLYPAAQALLQSLYMQDAFGMSSEFVGLENFAVLFSNPDYGAAFCLSLVYALGVTVCTLALGLLVSWHLVQVKYSQKLYQSLLTIPYAIAPAVSGVLWLFLFSPSIGFIPDLLAPLGITWNHVLDQNQALVLISIAAVWKQVPYDILFLVIGLQAIPASLMEAAAVDGAGPVRRFFSVVLPGLSPTLFYLITMNMVFAFFDTFAIIHQTTQGGPETATTTLVYKVFKDGFLGMDQGSSAAQSVVLILLVSGLTFFQFRKGEDKVSYF